MLYYNQNVKGVITYPVRDVWYYVAPFLRVLSYRIYNLHITKRNTTCRYVQDLLAGT